jgi:hypothetical protein
LFICLFTYLLTFVYQYIYVFYLHMILYFLSIYIYIYHILNLNLYLYFLHVYIHIRSRPLSALRSLHLQILHLQSFTSANPYIFTPLQLQILRPDVFVFCLLCCEAAPCCLLPWHRDGWQQKRAWQTQKIHIDRTHIFLSLSFLLLSLNLLCLSEHTSIYKYTTRVLACTLLSNNLCHSRDIRCLVRRSCGWVVKPVGTCCGIVQLLTWLFLKRSCPSETK